MADKFLIIKASFEEAAYAMKNLSESFSRLADELNEMDIPDFTVQENLAADAVIGSALSQ